MRIFDGKVYRDATPEEIAEFERQRAEIPEPEPTIADLENAIKEAINSDN